MNDEQKAKVLEAIKALATENPDAEVTAEVITEKVGFDVTAEQLDAVVGDMKNEAVLEAIKLLADKVEPGKKPHVKDIEEIVGFDISAGDRDAAWSEYQNSDEVKAAEKAAADAAKNSNADNGDAPMIKNNYSSALVICGTRIEPGKTAAVPKFNPEQSVIKLWVERKVIAVE